MKRIKLSLLKKIKSFLLVFMVLILFLPGSLGFAAGNNEDPETLQNCTPSADSVVESVIKTAPMNPEFLEDQQTDSIEAFSFVGSYGQLSSTGISPHL
ncbi:hypothetical protein [Methanosarcina barkeri]|uniref:hypothetical protein n=1 Tax=Methanosarcina barkeri TaxID=2208 RepID=UPI001FB31E03|nr:hypothetical protein [Methanosarcina barkeri]